MLFQSLLNPYAIFKNVFVYDGRKKSKVNE